MYDLQQSDSRLAPEAADPNLYIGSTVR